MRLSEVTLFELLDPKHSKEIQAKARELLGIVAAEMTKTEGPVSSFFVPFEKEVPISH